MDMAITPNHAGKFFTIKFFFPACAILMVLKQVFIVLAIEKNAARINFTF